MKKTILNKTGIAIFVATFILVNLSFAQTPWILTGNGGNIPNNILGTMNNFPLNIYSNGFHRMVVNGGTATSTVSINGVSQNVSGYFGIGPTGYFLNHPAVSMLHLYGANNTPFAMSDGWRSWMKSGIFISENSDAMYVGLKSVAYNRSDAIIG